MSVAEIYDEKKKILDYASQVASSCQGSNEYNQ